MFLLTLFSVPALAEPGDPYGLGAAGSVEGVVKSDLHKTASRFIGYFMGFLGLLIVATFIYAGVLFITAQGDEKQLEKAKKMIFYATIGTLIVMLSYVIVSAIVGVRNVVE
jgi:amino acid permease